MNIIKSKFSQVIIFDMLPDTPSVNTVLWQLPNGSNAFMVVELLLTLFAW